MFRLKMEPFIEVDPKEYGCKRVGFYWRDLSKLVERNKKEILEGYQNIKCIEILLGGDHGKGSMTFVVIIIVRYKDGLKTEPKVLELQLAQVNSTKDTMFLLKLIVGKITRGVTDMKPKDGRSQIRVLIEKMESMK